MKFFPKKLDIFVSKQFLLLFVGTFFICQFVLMMQFLWRYVNVLIGKGLSLDVLAQFFWYMGLILLPEALPLAILLSSLITFGNLGESSELTAIKASGVSLMQVFKPLIIIVTLIMGLSFFFQDVIAPAANTKFGQLLLSMKQKNPELEIPEGIFYDGLPNCNLYVQKKDADTGKLYGIMIYRMTGSFEDQAIILADSGMLQSTEEKKHLLLTLWSGEWFENMQAQELAGSASVPYRRETFANKVLVLDFDGDFNLTDASALNNNARGKSLQKIQNDIDSLTIEYDSVGRAHLRDLYAIYYKTPDLSKKDKAKSEKLAQTADANIDTLLNRMSAERRQGVVSNALHRVQGEMTELEFKSVITKEGDRLIRSHKIEGIKKFTLALTCLIFFFIGAPLGAIIRKGGLGFPVLISVIVFIIYYILQNTGYRMSRGGMWSIWFGMGLAPAVLIPSAAFLTYKANNDSVVFNMDIWRDLLMRALGMRLKRHVNMKEVIINDPDYLGDAEQLKRISKEVTDYSHEHNLKSPPNVIKVFFKYQPDHEIERLSDELEATIDDLSNTRDREIMKWLNHYPILSTKAHTRPFERRWLNILSAIIVPLGIFFYCRMWRFRLRLLKDLKNIKIANTNIISRIKEITHND